MRVLILRHGYYPRDPRVRREAMALVGRGHQVEVVCLRGRGEARNEDVGGAAITRLPLGHRRAGVARYLAEYGAFFVAAAVLAAVRHLRRPYDLVQVHTMPDALVFAALVPKLTGAHVLLDLHELMPELYAAKFGVALDHPIPRLLGRMERASVRFADACLAVSEPCLDRYVSSGSARGKFTVVMNAADPALFSVPARPARPKPPSGGPPLVVSHGTLVARYGFDLLIRALAELPDVYVEIVGDGEIRPELERLAAGLNVAERVKFFGFVPLEEIPRLIARADVGVVAHQSDVFTDLVMPNKLLEYVALGVPVAVARTTAVEAYFDEQMVAFFEPGNASDLACALRELLTDPIRRQSLAERAAVRYSLDLSWPEMARHYVGLVENLGGRSNP